MTHQELLDDWASASFSRASEFSVSISDDYSEICEKAIAYATENGLTIPARVIETIRDRMEWDEDNEVWPRLGRMLDAAAF